MKRDHFGLLWQSEAATPLSCHPPAWPKRRGASLPAALHKVWLRPCRAGLYGLFGIGNASGNSDGCGLFQVLQDAILRTRRSRSQIGARLCPLDQPQRLAKAGVLRLVGTTQSRSEPFAQLATISGDTNRVQLCATLQKFLAAAALMFLTAALHAQPASGPALWLRADSLSQADGTPITRWPDSSGNGFDATQPTPANRPIFKVDVLGGKPTVRFSDDGSSSTNNPNINYLISPLTLNANSNNFTAIILFRSQIVGLRDTLIQPLGAGNTVLYVETNSTPATNLFTYASAPRGPLAASKVYAANSWTIAVVEQNTAAKTLNLYRDGVLNGSTAIGTNATPSSDGWLFGCNKPLAAHGLKGDIAEILIYGRALTEAERRATESYLSSKYGLGGIPNQPPSFTKGDSLVLGEDSAPQRLRAWATGISAGPPTESWQTVTFIVTNNNPALFTAPPTISSDGTLTFTGAPDRNGVATVTVTARDTGGTANGGQDTSPPQTFTITIKPVNDPPAFSPGPNQLVRKNTGPQTVTGWATDISRGPPDEASQSVTFLVSTTNPSLFQAQPSISADGTLTYTTAADAVGGATVRVQLQDNGGTEDGARPTSAPAAFVIRVTPDGNAPPPRSGPPNIVFILADDLAYGDTGVYNQNARQAAGLPAIRTPTIDRMAAQGMRFTQFYTAPACAPSRVALMTGLHNGHTVIRGNGSNINLRREDPIIPELLKAAGYVNGMFGKWGVGEMDDVQPSPTAEGQMAVGEAIPNRKGFGEFFGYLSHGAAHFSFAQELLAEKGDRLWDTSGSNLVAIAPPPTYTQDLFAQRALEFIHRHQTNKFFLYLPFTVPHANATMNRMDAPEIEPEYLDELWPESEKRYASIISRMDRHIDLILDKLTELSLDQNTVVIIAGDNGAHNAGGHSYLFFNSSGPFRDRKFTVYEGGVRGPLIAWWPGHIPAGAVNPQVTAIWDLLPTFCELAGAPSLRGIDGISIVPSLLGNQSAQPQHASLYWETLPDSSGSIDRAVRMGDWKSVRHGANALELYNLALDIAEATNVSAANPGIVAQMVQIEQDSSTAPYSPAPAVVTLTPDAIGSSNTYTIDFGTLQVGASPVTRTFRVMNSATGYSSLMSGVVTADVNDPRLSLAPRDYPALAAGGTSSPFSVTFAPKGVGKLTGQKATITATVPGFSSALSSNSPLSLVFSGNVVTPETQVVGTIARQPDGTMLLRFKGTADLKYTIQATTDFNAWLNIGSVSSTPEGQFNFVDADAPLYRLRFYRSVWP